MAMSNEEALGGAAKKKPAMAHSQPGTTSVCDETLGGVAKKKPPMAHQGHVSSSHHKEALGGMKKKRQTGSTMDGGVNKAIGDATGA